MHHSVRAAVGQFVSFGLCWLIVVQAAATTWSAVAAEPSLPPSSAETAAIDELYRLDWLPRIQPGVTTHSFSSYDRTGGNNDGFSGKYSKLRVENGDSVLAEMSGPGGPGCPGCPGAIQRIWFTHSEYTKPGLLNLKREHIRIYLDGQAKPALDVPLEDVFSGKLPGFPKPLVGEGLGGYYCYVPIPYRNGCKVVVQGTGVRFYQINYRTFPSVEGRTTFVYPPTAAQLAATARAAAAWSACGDLSRLGVGRTEETTVEVGSAGGDKTAVTLPPGPRTIRAVWLKSPGKATTNAFRHGRIAITFDGAAKPAVDLPLAYLFCQAFEPDPFRSLWVGQTDKGHYNFLPMPYRRAARVAVNVAGLRTVAPGPPTAVVAGLPTRVVTGRANGVVAGRATGVVAGLPTEPPAPTEGLPPASPTGLKLTIVTEPLDPAHGNPGYFHAAYNESLPTKTGKYHPFLKTTGRGHYVGTYLATEGVNDKKLPLWLEGDDRFTVDGQLRIHGTGSEDYFNCGWYAVPGRLNGPGAFPLHGFPVYRHKDGREQAVAFRWHLTDPVHFDKQILAEMEHGPTNDVNADYRSAAFYYSDQP